MSTDYLLPSKLGSRGLILKSPPAVKRMQKNFDFPQLKSQSSVPLANQRFQTRQEGLQSKSPELPQIETLLKQESIMDRLRLAEYEEKNSNNNIMANGEYQYYEEQQSYYDWEETQYSPQKPVQQPQQNQQPLQIEEESNTQIDLKNFPCWYYYNVGYCKYQSQCKYMHPISAEKQNSSDDNLKPVCKFYLKNCCKKGINCQFRHPVERILSQNSLEETVYQTSIQLQQYYQSLYIQQSINHMEKKLSGESAWEMPEKVKQAEDGQYFKNIWSENDSYHIFIDLSTEDEEDSRDSEEDCDIVIEKSHSV